MQQRRPNRCDLGWCTALVVTLTAAFVEADVFRTTDRARLRSDAWQSQLEHLRVRAVAWQAEAEAAIVLGDPASDPELPPLPSRLNFPPARPIVPEIDANAAYFPEANAAPLDDTPPESSGTCLDDVSASDDADSDAEQDEEDEELSGLFNFIPHSVGPLTVEAIYTGEVFANARGGINTNRATRYRGNLDLVLTGDLEELFGIPGASFFVYGGSIHGESLSIRDVGDWQLASNLDPFPYVQLTQLHEAWWRQEFWDGRLYFKLGRQDANADFGYADLAGDFVNSSFITMPTIPLNVWPAQSLGVSGFFNVSDDLTIGAGVYQSNKFTLYWGDAVPGERGVMAMGHLEYRTQIGPEGELPGTWRAGAWLDTSGWGEITTAPVGRTFGNNYGFWFCGDQLLWKEQYGTDDEQGLGVFFEFGWAPGDRNYVDEYYGAGIVYRGLIPGRDADTAGVGIADVRFGQQTFERDGYDCETAVEFFYKAQLTDFISLQPDVQYIANPGGYGRDSIFAGIRFELTL
ncbi:MAG: carbohydrate porin [Planctomycetaceae bacterium]